MHKIALVCQHGASTGMCVAKMKEAAIKQGINCDIAAYSDTLIENVLKEKDLVLLAPQVGFKKMTFISKFPDYAHKIQTIDSMDFGMMDGEAILNKAIKVIEEK